MTSHWRSMLQVAARDIVAATRILLWQCGVHPAQHYGELLPLAETRIEL